jgi:hypothetical protein
VSFVRFARATSAVGAALLLVVSGCSSDPPKGEGTFCDATASASRTCKEPNDCDAVLTSSCTTLGALVSDATLTAAKDCLESGVCGAASCLSRARNGARPTRAHRTLAANFCTFCAPSLQDCEARFYQRSGRLPGPLVLPYAEDVVRAVDDACTGSEGCQAQFAQCAAEIIEQVAFEAAPGDVAGCVVDAFRRDAGGTGPGGGAQVATCTEENCAGCCRDDRCEDGTSELTCGSGASGCEVCTGGQRCTGGTCLEPCGPNNCPGCCEGNVCVPGTAKDACGGEGSQCTSCDGSFVCSNRTCIDGSCQATCTRGCCSGSSCELGTSPRACGVGGEACVDCGPGRSCQGGACLLDRTSLWSFYVSFAVVPDKNKQGLSWDPLNGAPDPYLVVYTSEGASSHAGFTTTKMNTTIPFWAETPLEDIKASELLSYTSIDIWDEDPDFDDYIGGCKLPLTPAIFDGSLQSHVCPATASGVEVKVYFRINPAK